MKRLIQLIVASTALTVTAAPFAQSVRELNYDANADLLTLPSYGEVAGIATNSRGHVFVYARTGHAVATLGDERTFYHGGSRLFQFDPSGKLVKEIGQGVYAVNFAQQVRVDPQDNVWIVDSGSNQVVKFDADGRFLLVLGRKPENITLRAGAGMPARQIDVMPEAASAAGGRPSTGSGQAAAEGGRGGGFGGRGGGAPGAGIPGDSFNRPADVTWDRAGNIYVADGFGPNNRIAKFTKDGNFVKSWGQTGSAQGQFNRIRGIASDAAGNIYVADAGNNRIQVFDGEGTFKSQITGIGTPQAICVSGGATQYLYSSNSNDPESMDNGEIYKVQLNGQVVGKFGKAGKLPKEFGIVNAIDCRTENDLWVGEVWNWRAQKVTLRR
jgi:DNA-binding beta-propeller fold protein YncE